MVSLRKKWKKYIEYIYTKILLLVQQKKYNSGGVCVKYMLEKAPSPVLVVVFSAFTRKGLKARYNYVRTLKDVPHNKLFILDDFAQDRRGAYYIGHNMEFDEEKATIELIKYIREKVKAKKILFCGSSKGGWAALNIGLQFPHADIISGGPQYKLGQYLRDSGNLEALCHIVGQLTEGNIHIIDGYLKERIRKNPYKASQRIFLHYSNQEHTYREHIQFLLEDLKEEGYYLEEDVADYADHGDISYFFPDYLCSMVTRLSMGEE